MRITKSNTPSALRRSILPFFIISGLILFICIGCGRDTDMQNQVTGTVTLDPEMYAEYQTLISPANNQFGFNLFNEIRKTEPDTNIFISPLSVSVALAMTLNGAADDTEQAMINTMQLKDANSESINLGYALLQQVLQTSDSKVTLTIANSLWGRQGFTFNPDFLTRNTQFFNAEISTLDFNDTNSVQTINNWVNTNTNGKIPEILDEIEPNAVLFLINAIYFKGAWQTEFDPDKTSDGAFQLPTGGSQQVPMMSRTGDYPYYYAENFQAVSLPYGDGKISMYIFLPAPDSDLGTFLESLNAENWEKWMTQFHEQELLLRIPKFKLEYGTKELNDALTTLGMGVAFDSRHANFSRMATLKSGNLYIDKVAHKTFIEVNEEGTEAAAVTVVGVVKTSLPPAFIADRPFFFAIRDNETGTVLFMGTVVKP